MKKKTKYKVAVLSSLLILGHVCTALAADGWRQDEQGQWQYTENDKKVTNRWIPGDGGTWRFVGSNGLMVVSNWVNFESERYYVNEEGVRLENQWFSTTSVPNQPHVKAYTTWYYAGEGGKIYRDGWFDIGGHEFYFNSGGGAVKDSIVTVEGQKYYVDGTTGKEHSGWFSVERLDGKGNPYVTWYYANDDGTLYFDGWKEIDGNFYYFYAGANSPRKAWFTLDDKRYYLDENGVRQSDGWFSISGVGGNGQEYTNWYYAESDGNIARGGFKQMDGKWYYFDVNGLSYRKRWYVDPDKKRYYLDEDGILQDNGWFKITTVNAVTGVSTDAWYYAKGDGSVLTDGIHEIEGKVYYFDANGFMYKDRWINGKNGKRQYVGKDGVMPREAWFSISGVRTNGEEYTNWYYADQSGYILKEGWHTIDGKEYYMNASGIMYTGWFTVNDDDPYYCDETGARLYGWQKLKIPESWSDDNEVVSTYIGKYGDKAYFYFEPNSGRKKYSKSGTYSEITVDGLKYCVDAKGIIQKGWVRKKGTSPAIKGYRYYMPEASGSYVEGQRAEDQWIKMEGPEDLDGPIEETWYYFNSEGEPVCASGNKFLIRSIDGKRYAFDKYGRTLYGFLEIEGDIYYFGTENDRSISTGRCMIDDGLDKGKTEYYFDSRGKGVTGIKDGRFYYKGRLQKADAATKYEVFEVEGNLFRLIDSSGKVVKGKTVKDGSGGEWVVSSDGTIRTYASTYVADVVEPEADDWDY